MSDKDRKHANAQLEAIQEKLKAGGMKLTHQRIEIIRELLEFSGHPNVSEVFEAVRRKIPSISQDTVYRTVRALSDAGILTPVGHSQGGMRFDTVNTPHNHFRCSVCGEIYDFNDEVPGQQPIPRRARQIGRVRGARLEVHGVCRNCIGDQEETVRTRQLPRHGSGK